ncbi:hypothetical protein D3C75_756470 [compost metagenome]
MAAVRQRGGQLDLPEAFGIDGGGADQHIAAVNVKGGVGIAGAAEQRRGVVGERPAVDNADPRADVVQHLGDDRNGWRGGVRGGEGAFQPGVARFVGGGHRQRFPVTHRWIKGDGEVAAVAHYGGTNHRRAVIDGDGAARFGPPGEGGAGVDHREAVRRIRGNSVHGNGSHRRAQAGVARRIGGGGGKVMLTVIQRNGGLGQGPFPGFTGGDFAYQRIAVVNAHHRVGLGGAAQGRTGVVGRVAVGDRALHRAGVVDDQGDGRCRWRRGVDVNRKGVGWVAGVSGRIGGNHR